MNKKLNILFLSGWYPNRVLPTLGNFVQKHAEAVALHSNVVALNAIADINCKQTFEVVANTINNVYTINVYYKKVTHTIPLLAHIQKYIRFKAAHALGIKLAEQKLGKIDIVHHNILYPTGMIARGLSKRKNIPYIVTEHSTAYLKSKDINISNFEKRASVKIARDAAFITPVSNDLKKAMLQLGYEGNYEVVYNVVDTKLFQPKTDKTTPTKIKFLHISTLDDPHKNISGMLRAATDLGKERNDFEFHFVGDGDTTPHIETAKKLGIYNSTAFFDGTKSTAEVAELMRNSDCFVLFSNYENLPVVIIEALASGIPVISSNVGGIHEHITNDKGVLIAAKDEAALKQALLSMITDIKNNKYNSIELSAYADQNFSYEKVSEKFHHLYKRVLNKHV